MAFQLVDLGKEDRLSDIHDHYSIIPSIFSPFTRFTSFSHFTVSFPPHWFFCGLVSSPPIWCILTKLHDSCVARLQKDRGYSVGSKFSINGSALQNVTHNVLQYQTCSALPPWHIYKLIAIILPLRPFIPSKLELCFVDAEATIAVKLPRFVQPHRLSRIWLDQAQRKGQR